MSAGICLMNCNGIAMAADSAVSIKCGYARNNVNKLFKFCPNNPIGVIVYSNSALMGIPVETIFADYYHSTGNKSFSTVEDCVDSFLTYLCDNADRFGFGRQEEKYIQFACEEFFKMIQKRLLSENTDAKGNLNISEDTFVEAAHATIDGLKRTNDGIAQYVRTHHAETIQRYINSNDVSSKMGAANKEDLIQTIYCIFGTALPIDNYVGLAISGYGQHEILPHLENVQINSILGNSVWIRRRSSAQIDDSKPYSITTYAQTSAMDTFIYGISPENCKRLEDKFLAEFSDYEKTMVTNTNDTCTSSVGDILKCKAKKIVNETKNDYAVPLITSFSALRPVEMALMAEKLIDITSLRRMIIVDELSGTVGGPTDVCVITKASFEWIKRKKSVYQ